MKNEIIKIVEDLKQDTITETEARTLLLCLFDVSESYSILITDIPNFRKELITMIEQVRYQTGRYNVGSSTEIAERFERTINSR